MVNWSLNNDKRQNGTYFPSLFCSLFAIFFSRMSVFEVLNFGLAFPCHLIIIPYYLLIITYSLLSIPYYLLIVLVFCFPQIFLYL